MKEGASPEELSKAKETAKSSGGTITHEFTLIKAFTYVHLSAIYNMAPSDTLHSVEFPEDKVGTLSTNEHINVEQDGEVKTQ